MAENPLKDLHDMNPMDAIEAAFQWGNIVTEWSDISSIPLHDMMIMSTLSQATQLRFANDENVVQTMIDNGVDPDIAFDRTTNWTIWVMTMLYVAYNMGRGKDAAEIAEIFSEYIATLDMHD